MVTKGQIQWRANLQTGLVTAEGLMQLVAWKHVKTRQGEQHEREPKQADRSHSAEHTYSRSDTPAQMHL